MYLCINKVTTNIGDLQLMWLGVSYSIQVNKILHTLISVNCLDRRLCDIFTMISSVSKSHINLLERFIIISGSNIVYYTRITVDELIYYNTNHKVGF